MPPKKLVILLDVETGAAEIKNGVGGPGAGTVDDIEDELKDKRVKDASSISVIGTEPASPGCRYVNVGGVWYKVCT